MTLYQVLHELQIVLALILGACPLCRQPNVLALGTNSLVEQRCSGTARDPELETFG